MDTADVRQYVALRQRVKELEAAAKGVKEEADSIEQRLLDEFAQEGVDRMTLDGITVYLKNDHYPAMKDGVDRAQVVAALAGNEHSRGLVTEGYNGNSFNAFIRELAGPEGDQPLPEYLADLVEVHTKSSLRTRKAD